MKQNLSCFSLTIKEFSQAPEIFPALVKVNLSKRQSTPGERITALRAAVRKTIELLNEPYVRHVLEQRGIDVDERLMELRSRFTVLAKYPLYIQNGANPPIEKYEYPPLEFIECKNEFLSQVDI
jgi:hypothetical protein